jgi:hypothetical protein
MRIQFWQDNLKERDILENIGVDGEMLAGFMWLRIETSGGLFEHDNERSGVIKR